MTTATVPADEASRTPATTDDPTSPWGGSDEERRRSLRRMKALATGLFGLAALIFLVTILVGGIHAEGWLGYVQAGSEAAMVGALADWFAVTALFRHPLGLPIPHTAIIPTRKDQMGSTLGEFVGTHFLTDEVVRDKVASTEVTRRAGEWLAQPDNAARVAGQLGQALRGLLAVLDDEQMKEMIERVIAERVERTEVSPALGHLLGQVVSDRAHTGIVDVVAERTYAWIVANRTAIMGVVGKQAPGWTPRLLDDIVADRIHFELVKFLAAVRDDPEHEVRRAIDRMLVQFADDLRTNEATRERVERAKVEMFEHPDVQRSVSRIWETAQRVVLEAADDPTSELRVRGAGALEQAGRALATDPTLQANLDGWVTDTVVNLVRDYKVPLTSVISDTVARWDGPETARRIELAAGRDLQFIRINGTVIGALAGLVIHAFSQLVG
ncbi:MAG: DUF445 domain-containing protein [Candidatus Nanopelagicales bacterium]|jgi:uncharacterized membrane-anchored protein YjiN (DUF445 family)|nr:DUF445 domain-containing protein [Candidatus Nanopelagicales bacterium]